MPHVKIYHGKGVDEEQLKKLLEEAGCAPADDVDVEEEAAIEADETLADDPVIEDCDNTQGEPETLVVVLNPELGDDDQLEGVLKGATARGCIIVGVWPKGTISGTAPPPFKKYSSDQVVWDVEAVRKAICGSENEPAYQDPKGAPQPAPDTPRHCC